MVGLKISEIKFGSDLIGPLELNLTQPEGFKFSGEVVLCSSALACVIIVKCDSNWHVLSLSHAQHWHVLSLWSV